MDICIFIESQTDNDISPNTIKNKLSNLRRFLRLSNVSLHAVNSEQVSDLIEAISRDSSYTSKAKLALDVKHFKAIVDMQPHSYMGTCLRAIFLFLYYGAFRQSEVVPVNQGSFNHEKSMTRGDIKIVDNVLHIWLRWAKNMQKHDQVRLMTIQPSPDMRYCPVTAYRRLLTISPTIRSDQPVFVFQDQKPIPVTAVRSEFNRALTALHLNKDSFSLHSIRKCSATTAYTHGCAPIDVKRHGGWRSDAHLVYIQPKSEKIVTSALAKAISQS